MATDIYGGTSGDITASGFNGDIDGWSAEIAAQTINYRTFASKWQNKKNVSYGGSGQFTGTIQFDAATTSPMPSATGGGVDIDSFEGVSLTLTAEAGCTITGTANITAVSVNRPAADRMTGTWRFEFDGEVNITWDETGA